MLGMAVKARRRRRGSKSVSKEKDFFKGWIQNLIKLWQKCFVVREYYVENDYAQL
jgi:hypothetical protein